MTQEMSQFYTIEEVTSASTEYFGGDALAGGVFATKYALTDDNNRILELTPDDMHHRLAREFARIEQKYPNPMSETEIYSLLKNFSKIVPQGSPMAGIGNPYQIQSISNCFVIETFDSYGGILYTDQQLVQIAKRRGGIGFDISKIRPKGMLTKNAARTTDGLEVFMDRFSNSCREVAQNGRRGALMLTCSVHHPQIRDFIKIKKNRTRVTGANISIRLSDEFMNAVEKKEKFQLRFPVDSAEPTFVEYVDAQEIWTEIIESAHASAEPGLLFWDTILKWSPADCYADVGFKTVSTNPCSELPLSVRDSCRLLLLNLMGFVKNAFTTNASFDYADFAVTVKKAQRLMDDMVDIEIEQIDKIIAKVESDPEPLYVKQVELDLWHNVRQNAVNGRRTGLGLTGLGDALAAIGLRYGTDESIEKVEKIYRHLAINAYRSSAEMAEERGAFPVFDSNKEIGHPFLTQIIENDTVGLLRQNGGKRRNIALLTTAPGGSLSTQTQTTSGIECVYKLWYTRRKKITGQDADQTPDFIDQSGDKWKEYDVFHHCFKQWMDINGKTKEDVEQSPYWKASANEIDWQQGVKLQAAAQKWIDHAISRTQNLPETASIEDVKKIYEAAWHAGCKGFTIYREGSRTGVLIDQSEKTKKGEQKELTQDEERNGSAFKTHSAPKRPDVLDCDIHRATVKGEAWTILVGLMDGKPYELLGGLSRFVEIPKKHTKGKIVKKVFKAKNSSYDLVVGEGDDEMKIKDIVSAFDNPNHAALTRMVSLSLRHGAPVQYICEQMLKADKEADLFSFTKVISRVLKNYIDEGAIPGGSKDCGECGAKGSLKYSEGCISCANCSWSRCS